MNWLQELKPIVGQWADRNFPANINSSIIRSITGQIEEVGELAHCILKREQNIRKAASNPKELIDDMKDAIGDITVYMLNTSYYLNLVAPDPEQLPTLYLNEVALAQNIFKLSEDESKSIYIILLLNACVAGYLINAKVPRSSVEIDQDFRDRAYSAMSGIVAFLSILCLREGFNYREIVEFTVNKVTKRNWIDHPTNADVMA